MELARPPLPAPEMSPAPGAEPESLNRLVARISTDASRDEAIGLALDAALGALKPDFAVLLQAGAAHMTKGAQLAGHHARELEDAARRGRELCSLPGMGELDFAAAPVPDGCEGWVVVGRRQREPFTPAETATLDLIANVLALHLRAASATAQERGLRRRGERELEERRRVERELAHQALHDRLTGLPNRTLLRDRAVHALSGAQSHDGLTAILYIDLDQFKRCNDAMDHRRGDQLLVRTAQRLSTILSLEDNRERNCTIARQGGDEFIVLCEDLRSERDAVAIAQQIQDVLRAPFYVDGQDVLLTASVGIALAPGSAEPGDADVLLRNADVALARAKDRGRDRYEIFDERMRARLLDRVALENELRAAIEQDELRLLYQPVVTIAERRLASVEALIRWEHPSRGLLSPAEFIPLAEESELIVAIGAWVIDEACNEIRRWREGHPAELGVRVSVNVSARQLDSGLVDTVKAALRRTGVPPSMLALEITERTLIEHRRATLEVLTALQELGVAVVLDDFGTGYSSLGYLTAYPLSELKLDQSFTLELGTDPRTAKIVAATIDMARALGMTVVAEGVETEEQLEILRRLGCDYAQGFLFAVPLAGQRIFERLRREYEHDSTGVAQRIAERSEPAMSPTSLDQQRRRQQAAVGRIAGWLFLIGSATALLTGTVIGAPRPAATAALTIVGSISGLACLRVPWERVSPYWLNVIAVLATVEITVAVIAVGRYGPVLLPLYLLIATATAYGFRDRRAIAGHVGLIVVVMVIPLVLSGAPRAIALPATIVAVLVMVAMTGAITYLREMLEGSVSDMRALATSDPLTGVGNYRLLHDRLAYEIVRHQRDHGNLAVLVLDLDRFKQVNERRGHAAGDDVLRRVGLTLRQSVRDGDTVVRQGGDEFAVLAPNTDATGATMLASRIRDRLGRVQFFGDSWPCFWLCAGRSGAAGPTRWPWRSRRWPTPRPTATSPSACADASGWPASMPPGAWCTCWRWG